MANCPVAVAGGELGGLFEPACADLAYERRIWRVSIVVGPRRVDALASVSFYMEPVVNYGCLPKFLDFAPPLKEHDRTKVIDGLHFSYFEQVGTPLATSPAIYFDSVPNCLAPQQNSSYRPDF